MPVYNLRVSKSSGFVALSWPPESAPEGSHFRIYRYEPGQKPVKIADTGPDAFTFKDEDVKAGQLYYYYLTVVSAGGLESDPGNKAGIRF